MSAWTEPEGVAFLRHLADLADHLGEDGLAALYRGAAFYAERIQGCALADNYGDCPEGGRNSGSRSVPLSESSPVLVPSPPFSTPRRARPPDETSPGHARRCYSDDDDRHLHLRNYGDAD